MYNNLYSKLCSEGISIDAFAKMLSPRRRKLVREVLFGGRELTEAERRSIAEKLGAHPGDTHLFEYMKPVNTPKEAAR